MKYIDLESLQPDALLRVLAAIENITIQELADRLGVNYRIVSDTAKGRRFCNRQTAESISRVYGIDRVRLGYNVTRYNYHLKLLNRQ